MIFTSSVTLIRKRKFVVDMSDNEIEDVSFLPGWYSFRKIAFIIVHWFSDMHDADR